MVMKHSTFNFLDLCAQTLSNESLSGKFVDN